MSIKLAIVGIEVIAGGCDSFNALIDTSYEGKQHFVESTLNKRPGAYLKDFEVDAFSLKIPPKDLQKFAPQQLLLLTVLHRAIGQVKLKHAATSQTAEQVALKIIQSVATASQPVDRVAEAVIDGRTCVQTQRAPVAVDENTGEAIAHKLSQLHRCTTATAVLPHKTTFPLEAINQARALLTAGEAKAVAIGMSHQAAAPAPSPTLTPVTLSAFSYEEQAQATPLGEGAAAIVLKSYEQAITDKDHIYAVIEAASRTPLEDTSAEHIATCARQLLRQVEADSETVGYIELAASDDPVLNQAELSGLTQTYSGRANGMGCAVGSIKTSLGDTGPMADLLGIIHTALCLYCRYLPPVPQWNRPRDQSLWQTSAFYAATEAQPWLLAKQEQQRRAAVNSRYGHLLMTEAHHPHQHSNPSPSISLLAIAADDASSLLAQLDQVEQRLQATDNVAALVQEITLAASAHAPYALVLVGLNKGKLLKEIERARRGLRRAFALSKDWKSPAGSYFTAQPQGSEGSVAFVYPGAFNSYLGMGRALFHRFPQLFDRADRLISNPLAFFRGQHLYPVSQHRLSKRELEAREEQLGDRPLALLETGTGFSVLFTEIIQQVFKVTPQSAFGYSMGESTMMYALGVWPNADYGSEFINRSSLFRSGLAGSQTIVQQHWPDAQTLHWCSYVLLASPAEVRACLQQEPRVYLTHINTPQEVVIAGCAAACKRVIAALQCDAFRSPANLVLHCEAIASAYPTLRALNQVPNLNPASVPASVKFYTSSTYRSLPLEKEAVAHHLATGICQPLDFPQLVNRVYAEGARIFIELGAGGACSRWIGRILDDRDHTTMCINRRGADDYTTIIKVLAQLVSHRVPVDLLPLFSQADERLTRNPGGAQNANRQRQYLQRIPFRAAASNAIAPLNPVSPNQPVAKPGKSVVFNTAEVLELTQLGVSRLFGPDYQSVDSYARRVRMPSPPFLFVSRVTELSGDRGHYKTGVIETEYDVPPDAWYSVDGQLPIGICAEAGHGLLLLLSYLGSDFESQGQRSFRLLDLNSEFVAPQPATIETLRYRVKINSHMHTTKSLLVFFEGECWVGETLWMQLSGGCAGLFSDEELEQGQGIVTPETASAGTRQPTAPSFVPLLSSTKSALTAADLEQLSRGNLSVFGPQYASAANPALRLPVKLKMLDEVVELEANGAGRASGNKQVTPEDWYYLCHFKNDPTMPGSLMVEGGSQLLQTYMLWLGLQTRTKAAHFQPLPGCKMAFQFRGQVTPAIGTLSYQLEVVEIGLEPHPYAIAHVRVHWAGKTIATIDNLGLQMVGEPAEQPAIAFSQKALQALASGKVSDCLGADYAPFDQRRCVRIPNGDFRMVSRVLTVPESKALVPGSKLVTEYDIATDSWLYRDNAYPYLPYCAHIEAAGQPCIFLGLYLNTPLRSLSDELHFRNIDGQATVLKEIDLRGKTITDEIELTSVSVLAGATLQSFDYRLSCEGDLFYQGSMVFGYFSSQVLVNQSGLDGGRLLPTWYETSGNGAGEVIDLMSAASQRFYQPQRDRPYARLATGRLNLLDRAIVVAAGGHHHQGYIYAEKSLSSEDWYVPYHFYQDPVMPGALGIETILQAMQVYALHQGLDQDFVSPRFAQALNHAITWKYRGQITPDNRKLYLEVHISEVRREAGRTTIVGEASLWKETMRIYAIQDIALCIQEIQAV